MSATIPCLATFSPISTLKVRVIIASANKLVTSRQTIPLRLSVHSKVSLIPQVPPTLLPRECEQSLYSTFPELKDSNGAEIGKWEDFMVCLFEPIILPLKLNSFTAELVTGFPSTTPSTKLEPMYPSEVEMLRDAS